MANKQVVILFCNFTSAETRSRLHLSDLKTENLIRRILRLPQMSYHDAAQWIRSFIDYFSQSEKYELHIVCLQQGLKQTFESFDMKGVCFHYVKSGLNLLQKVLDYLFHTQKRKSYPIYRERYAKALGGINADIVMMCGAENPDYTSPFLAYPCGKKLVILQTWMNDPKRIEMGLSNAFRRENENRVLKSCNNIAICDRLWVKYVKYVNLDAKCFDFIFPTVEPQVDHFPSKEYDFAFFAGIWGVYKGTDDLVEAMSQLVTTHPGATLNMIGGAAAEYMAKIRNRISELQLDANISITPSFSVRNDVFHQVLKSRFIVLPSITASLNSTVRESMFLGLPTIVYRTWATEEINTGEQSVLEADMENISDLVEKMRFALDNPEKMNHIGESGKVYAETHYSNKAFYKNMDSILESLKENE